MQELKRTTPSAVNVDAEQLSDDDLAKALADSKGFLKPHYHVVFCDYERGAVLCAPAKDGHTHEVQVVPAQPPQPAQQDPETGQPIPGTEQPGSAAKYIVLPAEDGHTHDGLVSYVPKRAKSKESDDQVIRDVVALFEQAYELERESIEKGRKSEDFYWGDQWDKSLKSELEAQERAALTINKTGKYVNQLSGHERMNRTSVHFVPTENGDQVIADILNVLAKHDFDKADFPRECSLAFKDAIVPGRGWINCKMDFTSDLRGLFVAEQYDWDGILCGPHKKLDLSDCEYQMKHKLFSFAKFKQLWPEKAKELEGSYLGGETIGDLAAEFDEERSEPHVQYSNDQYGNGGHGNNSYPLTVGQLTLVDSVKKEFRVVECWRRTYEKVFVAANPSIEWYKNLHGWKKEDAKAIGALPGFHVIEANMPAMRISSVCGGLLLSDEAPADLAYPDFHAVPMYGMKRGNRFKGVVEDAKDPQRELNKRRSQSIDVVNKMSQYNYFYTPDTFVDPSEETRFKQESSTPGASFKVNDPNLIPQATQGVKFPNEIVALTQQSDQDLREMIDVAVEPTGSREAAQSLVQRQKMSLMGKEEYFDNLAFAKKMVGKIYVAFVQRYYSSERILRIIGHHAAREGVEINGQPYDPEIHKQQLEQKLKDADLSNYDVSVVESAYSPTQKMATSATIQEVVARGGQIPPQMWIETLDIPDVEKKKMLRQLEAAQQQQAQGSSDTRKMEIEKTLIAQGYIPPEVAQEFGVAQAEPQPEEGQMPQMPQQGQII